MPLWSQIKTWRSSNLDIVLDDLIGCRKKALACGDEIETMDLANGWEGEGATAAQGERAKFESQTALLLANLSAAIMMTGKAQSGLNEVATLVAEAQSRADYYGFKISADGKKVTDPHPIERNLGDWITPWETSHEDEKREREEALKECAKAVTEALNKAILVDEAYESALLNIANGNVVATEGLDDGNPGMPDLPPRDASTGEVAAWWAAHSEDEKKTIADESSLTIGSMDGVEGKYRDQANRKTMEEDLSFGKEVANRMKELKKMHPDTPDEDLLNLHELKLWNRYKDALEVKKSLERNGGDTQLLLYESATTENGHEHTHAAVAVGNVDTAKHVGTFIPGMGTDVAGDMNNITRDMTNLKKKAVNEVGGESVAIVGWVGYDAPVSPLEDFTDWSVMGTGEAEMGGDSAARFLEGIQDSRNNSVSGVSDVHQTLLGHSFGSTTSSYAAAKVRQGVLDEFGVFASPGVKNGAWDMNVPKGHNYVMLFDDDFIKKANDIGGFFRGQTGALGVDPYDDHGFTRLDPEDANTKKTGHSGYLVDESRSQEQLAKIIAGKAQ